MRATEEILRIWRKFDSFPMETLTKAWLHVLGEAELPRSVDRMREHREQYGTSGNCFDLAFWLMDELRSAGITCYPVGKKLGTSQAHAAVVAIGSDDRRYFCDLGDQWIQPILVDPRAEAYTEEPQSGFFPAAQIAVSSDGQQANIRYIRPGGKESQAMFSLEPCNESEFREAALDAQMRLRKPLVERRMRVCTNGRIIHWEYESGHAQISSDRGLYHESDPLDTETWAQRISRRSGIHEEIVRTALEQYETRGLL
ncbi:hypothetical protein B9G55_14580 [Saccharibacillus sp. O16]|nr:hypothetical protein B9G55_14580 [Saccharibacillus sp. O16]